MRISKHHLSVTLFACLSGLAFGADAPVTGTDTGANALQPIVVTAQRREQNMQSVGTSITALDGAALQRLGITDFVQIASQTPGMQFNQYGATVTVYNLRGVSQNDFSDHQEAPVAVYSDDAYIASTGALAGSLFDIQRVEVLRGPQGTLFGRNATGGLIQYISEKPKFDNDGYLTATFGNYGTVQTEGAANAALSEDVAARASFATDYHNGYILNRLGRSSANEKQYAGRIQFLYRPSEHGEIVLKLHALNNDHETGGNYSWAAAVPDATGRGVFLSPTSTALCPNLDGGCTPGGDYGGYINTYGPRNQAEDREGIFNRTVYGATLHITWNFDSFTLSSVSDYLHLHKRYGEDTDASPNFLFNYDTRQDFHQLSQELHLNGTVGALRWIGGVYFLNYHSDDFEGVALTPAFGGYADAKFSLATSSESAFGQVEYDLGPQFTAIAGARYSTDQKSYDYTNQPEGLIYNPSTDPSASRTYDNVTGKLELDYKPRSDYLLYGSVNRGAKGGGWSAPSSGPVVASLLPFGQEILTSYEVGEKATFWDGRARINGALFYYDYRHYQGFLPEGLNIVVQNKNARIKGGELEFAVAPVRDMNLQLGVSHLETIAKGIPLPAGGLADTELPQAPRWSLNAEARYEWTIPAGRLAIEADSKWNSHEYLELENSPVDYERVYIVSNARVTYSNTRGNWDITLWSQNLADRLYRVYNLDLSIIGIDSQVYGPPRTFGATFSYRWGNK